MSARRWLGVVALAACAWPLVGAEALGAAPTAATVDQAHGKPGTEMIATGESELAVIVSVPEGCELTEGAPLSYAVRSERGRVSFTPREGRLEDAQQMPIIVRVHAPQPGRDTLELQATVPYCTTREPKLCKLQTVSARQNVQAQAGGATRWSLSLEVEER